MTEEIINRNEVRIASKEIKTYVFECIRLFGKYDQIILSTSEPFKEKTNYIIDFLNPVGIVVDKEYSGIFGKRLYKSLEQDVVDPKTGRIKTLVFFRIGLTKVPDLYMYTGKKQLPDIAEEPVKVKQEIEA